MNDLATVERLLNKHHVPIGMVKELVGPLEDYDAVLLTGSVADELSNDASDVDLMAIGGHPPNVGERFELDSGATSVCINLSDGTLLELLWFSPNVIRELAGRFEAALAVLDCSETALAQKRRLRILSMNDRLLLHRLRTGRCLHGQTALDSWRAEWKLDLLPDYLFHTAMGEVFSLRQDARAQIEVDRHTSLLMIQEAAGLLSHMLLASLGESNPAAKWRATLLAKHAASSATVRDELLDLMLTSVAAEPKERLGTFERVLTAVFTDVFARRRDLAEQTAYWGRRLDWARFSGGRAE